MDDFCERPFRIVGPSDTFEPFDDGFDARGVFANPPPSRQPSAVDDLLAFVGTAKALDHLDREPLPDERFDWTAVELQDRDFVERVLALSDRYCEQVLDLEYRTIARRILARVAARDPRPFRRSTRIERCAAGLIWLAGRGSGEFGRHGPRSSERLWAWFGVQSCSDRGRSLQRAGGLQPDDALTYLLGRDVVALGDAALLHSQRRALLIAQRDISLRLDERRPYKLLGNGKRVQVRAAPVKIVVSAKGASEGRSMVILALGDELEDVEFFALTIPDAHDLVARVQQALNDPTPI
jgi:hypothetical protein